VTVTAIATVAVTMAVSTPAGARGSRTTDSAVQRHLRSAIRHLPVASHSHAGRYDRTRAFGDWISQGHGCDTRAVVLKVESLRPTTQNRYCTIESGRWYSFYNARYYTKPYGGAVQIDHVVPVENAWISGAWRWTHATRVRFYNDLGDQRTLVAVDRHDNEAKGDQDPTHWLPAHGKCRYLRSWVAVKTRWHLSVTATERATLLRLAGGCTNRVIKVTPARIDLR
jgi:hypothetical protein